MANKTIVLPEDFAIAIIFVKPLELHALSVMLDEEYEPVSASSAADGNTYILGRIGTHNVVLAGPPMGQQGKARVSEVVAHTRTLFENLTCGLLVGIGGGVPHYPSKDVRLGDVVVGAPEYGPAVVQYDFGKDYDDRFEIKESLNKPPESLLNAVSTLEDQFKRREDGKKTFFARHMERYRKYRDLHAYIHPGSTDRLFVPEYLHLDSTKCDEHNSEFEVKRTRRADCDAIKIHRSTILSGDRVIKSGAKRDEYSKRFYDALCFEMEAAGLTDSFPCLVIRGICDYADSHKSKEWQEFAAGAAAAYARQLLLLLRRKGSRTPSQNSSFKDNGEKDSSLKKYLASLDYEEIDARYYDLLRFNEGDTGEWLFKTKQFEEWDTRSCDKPTEKAFLILRGKAGSGKSVLMRKAFERSKDRDEFLSAITVRHFFDGRHEENRSSITRTIEGLYRSILRQLLLQLSRKPDAVLDRFAEKRKEEGRYEWANGELALALTETILANQYTGIGIRVYIDALDECSDGLDIFLEFAMQLVRTALDANIDLGFCFACRHYPDFGLLMPKGFQVHVDANNSGDIDSYLKKQLEKIPNEVDRKELHRRIAQRASSVFLWANLMSRKILEIANETTQSQRLELLQETPMELENLYKSLFKTDIKDRDEIVHLLKIVLYASRLLTIDQLRHALAFRRDFGSKINTIEKWERNEDKSTLPTGKAFLQYIVSRSRGLLEARPPRSSKHRLPVLPEESEPANLTVQFVHESASYHFKKEGLMRLQNAVIPDPAEQYNLDIFNVCVRVLKFSKLKQNGTIHILQYALDNWMFHARQCEKLLLKEHLPDWMIQCVPRTKALVDTHIEYLKRSRAPHIRLVWKNGNLLLILASQGCTKLIELHLQVCKTCKDPGTNEDRVRRAIFCAIQCRQSKTARYLLERCYSGSLNDPYDGVTLLYSACYRGLTDIVEYLLSSSADMFQSSQTAYVFPLHAAVALEREDVLDILLRKTDPDKIDGVLRLCRTGKGTTALHIGAKFRRGDVLETLLNKAKEPAGLLGLKDKDGFTPIDLAKAAGDEDLVDDLSAYLE